MSVSDTPPASVSPRETHLANGLKVIVQPVHTAPLVSVWCWYRVGSRDEGPGRTGVSHWVEHMNFKGTTNIPRDQMKGIVERFGGTWNGYTWLDQTTYLETAGRDALEQMLFIEAERMANGLYESQDCESERTVIISELQGAENDPEQLLDTEVTATAFRAHTYRHPTIGWLEDLKAMTRDDLYAHYRRHYVPANATLVIVGDVQADEALSLAERKFGRIPSGARPERPRILEPQQVGERRVLLERPGATAYLKAAWHAPAVTDQEFLPMLVLDAALTGAKGLNVWSSFRGPAPQRKARLYTALVERGFASTVSGALLPTSDPFLYSISLTATEGIELSRLEAAFGEAIARVREDGVTESETARARRQLRARLAFENDSVTNVAHQLGYFDVVAGPGFLSGVLADIEAVTADQVSATARRRLQKTSCTVGWFKPIEQPA